jgi:ribosome-binding factor A
VTRRLERVNSLIREEISDLLRIQVKDPRLGNFISITEVSTSPDLKHATVFVSYIGGVEERRETIAALSSASGFFHRELTKRLKMRHVPELSFQWDDSIERGDRISRIMDRIATQQEDI